MKRWPYGQYVFTRFDFNTRGQRYDAAGQQQGGEFAINSTTANHQENARVAMDADGDFVVVWQSLYQDGGGHGIYAQRYNAAGGTLDGEFRVNTTTANAQSAPNIAMDADGDFVVVWQSALQDGDGFGIVGQRYNAAGVAQGAEFQINTTTAGDQELPDVAMAANGDFVVVWQGADSDRSGVYGQRFNAAGVAQGSEFRVNTTTTHNQFYANVAMDPAGNFTVAWQSYGPDENSYASYAQRYSASGVAQSSEFKLNTALSSHQGRPSLAIDADGDMIAIWQSNWQDGSRYGVYGRQFPREVAPLAVSSITSSDTLLTSGETATFTIAFSDGVTGFTLDDLTPTNGTLSGFAAVNASTYTVVFTPSANTTGTGGIAFAAGSYTDLAANSGPAGSFLTQQIDTAAPTVSSISSNDTLLSPHRQQHHQQ